MLRSVRSASALVVPSNDPFWVDLRDYGAVGNGATDDTAAIQAAIDAIAAQPYGGTVYFPPGVYLTTSTLFIRTDRVRLLGGGVVVLYLTTTADSIVVDGTTTTPGFIQYLTIEQIGISRGSMGVGSVLKLKNVLNSRILQCDFAAGEQSLYMDACQNIFITDCFFGELCSKNLLKLTNCLNIGIDNCFFQNNQPGSEAHIELNATNIAVAITACRFADGLRGIESAGGPWEGGTISGCAFDRVLPNAIRLAGNAERVSVIGNTLNGTGAAGVGIALEAGTNHCTVVGNVVHDYGTTNIDDSGTADVVASNVNY